MVGIGLLSWHTVGVVTARAMIRPLVAMPRVPERATGESMVRAVAAPCPMETRGARRRNQWLPMAAHGKSPEFSW